ncbi:hypothetical protein [Nostoc flagelliforme]
MKKKSGTESGQKRDKNRSNYCREGVLENGGCDTRNIRVSEKAARCHNERMRVLSIFKCHGTPDLRHLKKTSWHLWEKGKGEGGRGKERDGIFLFPLSLQEY